MKIKTFTILMLFFTCVFARRDSTPCEDSTFIALKNKPIVQMDPQEYDYFKTMIIQCEESKNKEKSHTKKVVFVTVIIITVLIIANSIIQNK